MSNFLIIFVKNFLPFAKGRVQCFSMQVVINEQEFCPKPVKKIGADPSCRFCFFLETIKRICTNFFFRV